MFAKFPILHLLISVLSTQGGRGHHSFKVGFTQQLLRREKKKKQQFHKDDIDSAMPWTLKGVRLSISVWG